LTVLRLLDESLATELVCVLRYRRHHFTARGIHSQSVAQEFLDHSNEEQGHADQIAERIVQEGRFAWDFESSSFRHRMAKDFPEWFHQWGTTLPENIELDADEQLITILADPLIARVRLEAKQGGDIDWLDLRIVFDIEGADLKPADIRRLLAAKGEHVRLADGSWRRVKLELSDEQIAMLDSLGIDLEAEGSDTHRLHWRQLAQEKAVEIVNPKAWEKIVQRMEEAKLNANPPVPPELTVTP
jgi:hypothetical protein